MVYQGEIDGPVCRYPCPDAESAIPNGVQLPWRFEMFRLFSWCTEVVGNVVIWLNVFPHRINVPRTDLFNPFSEKNVIYLFFLTGGLCLWAKRSSHSNKLAFRCWGSKFFPLLFLYLIMGWTLLNSCVVFYIANLESKAWGAATSREQGKRALREAQKQPSFPNIHQFRW